MTTTDLNATLHLDAGASTRASVANTCMDTRRLTSVHVLDADGITSLLTIQTTAMTPSEVALWLRQLASQVDAAEDAHIARQSAAPVCEGCAIQSTEVRSRGFGEQSVGHGVAGTQMLCALCSIHVDDEITEAVTS